MISHFNQLISQISQSFTILICGTIQVIVVKIFGALQVPGLA